MTLNWKSRKKMMDVQYKGVVCDGKPGKQLVSSYWII